MAYLKTKNGEILKTLDLFIHNCKICKELTILGFHQQVKWKKINNTHLTIDHNCPKCGFEFSEIYEVINEVE